MVFCVVIFLHLALNGNARLRVSLQVLQLMHLIEGGTDPRNIPLLKVGTGKRLQLIAAQEGK